MSLEDQKIEEELEALVAKVRREKQEVEPSLPSPEPDLQLEPPILTEPKPQDLSPAPIEAPSSPAKTDDGSIAQTLLGRTKGERVRTVAAFSAGMCVMAAWNMIVAAAVAGALGYGAYRLIRRGKDDEEIIDTQASIIDQ